MQYIYKNLKNITLEQIVMCINKAFADYEFDFTVSMDYIIKWFKGSNVDLTLSYGVFYDNELLGVLINAIDTYNGEKVAFDVATGIIKEHRGKHNLTNLFKLCETDLNKNGIKKYYLEVLQTNEKAINIYKKFGLDIIRSYILFTGKSSVDLNTNKIINTKLSDFDLSKIKELYTYKPSFQYKTISVLRNIEVYNIAYSMVENNIVSFCIYSSKTGAIVQFGRNKDIDEFKKVIAYVSKEYENLSFVNIDTKDELSINALEQLGFTVKTKQYEMSKNLLDFSFE